MSNEDQIRGLLKTFEGALDTSDVALAAGCYMKDAVAIGGRVPYPGRRRNAGCLHSALQGRADERGVHDR